MPVCRSLGKGLYEIRSDLTQGRIARVIFCVARQRMVLLHGFIKKTQKTPKTELDLALSWGGHSGRCERPPSGDVLQPFVEAMVRVSRAVLATADPSL